MNILKKPCSVCGEAGDGAHFGAEACRACAAFFRRSVALTKTYICRAQGSCVIQKNVRCMCRSCRFAKCLFVGMRKSAVQKHREIMAQSQGDQGAPFITPPHSIDFDSPSDPFFNTPVLTRMHENYTHLESIRRVIHDNGGNSLFQNKREPRAVAYKEANAVHLKEIGLVADWVIKSFPEFEKLHHEQKKLLFRNFFLPFMILECGYHCCIHDRTDILFLPSGDYIDCNRPETFYNHYDATQLLSSAEAVRMFAPSFDIYRRNILDPMRREKVDSFEFYTLCSLVLWDHGLEGQSEECVIMARTTRDKVLREVLQYYRTTKSLPDPSMRLANLLVLLPALQRSVRRFQEDVEITHVFNVYSVEEKFYELVSGRLSDTFFQVDTKIVKTEEIESVWDMNSGKVIDVYKYNPTYTNLDTTNIPSTSSSCTPSV